MQATIMDIGVKLEILADTQDMLAGLFADLGRAASARQHARNGGNRDPRLPRDIAQAHLPGAIVFSHAG